MKKIIRLLFFAALVVMIVIQFFPYGRQHENPLITGEPPWDSPETRATFYRTCADCHSNETRWPWYSHVAPVSWLVQHDVDEAREHFNISEWGRWKNHGDDAAHELEEGEMPLWYYVTLHPAARLTDEEKEDFIAGLRATFPERKLEKKTEPREKGEEE